MSQCQINKLYESASKALTIYCEKRILVKLQTFQSNWRSYRKCHKVVLKLLVEGFSIKTSIIFVVSMGKNFCTALQYVPQYLSVRSN